MVMRSEGCYRLAVEGEKGVVCSLSRSIWCFLVVSFFFYPALLDSSSSLLSPFYLFSVSLSLLSRNNLISVVVRSFYSGMFSDPFRLVWQLMQPIFELVSFYLVSFINQYVNFFSFDAFPEKIENLHLSCASYVVNKICILQICWAFVFKTFTLYQNLSSNWLWITQN